MRVLVVDDCPEDRELFRRYLGADTGTDILDAETLYEARHLIRQQVPDCVLVDYRLPDASGTEVVDALRPFHGDRPVGYVMVTGHGSEAIAVSSMRSGFDDYVVKNHLTPDTLRTTVTRAVERAQARLGHQRHVEDLEHFAAIMAHDLKAPLQSIKGFAELSQNWLRRAGPELVQLHNGDMLTGYLGAMLEGCETMEDLIAGLLRYAQSGSGQAIAWPVDANAVVARILNGLRGRIDAEGARVTVGPLPTISGDSVAITQVFQNLIVNGLNHGNGARTLIEVSAAMTDGWAEFSVADNGPGIPEADRERVFDPLVRLTTRETGGHGLGLAICLRIVERLGGGIWVVARAGGGADFRFRLPLWRS